MVRYADTDSADGERRRSATAPAPSPSASASASASGESWHATAARPERGANDSAALDPATRAAMEAQFGFDFSRVRIHTSAEAAARAGALGVPAYTEGEAIGFAPGGYAPATAAGRHLLAHELAHVRQQATGAARDLGPVARRALEADAERCAELVASGGRIPAPARLGSPVRAVQGFDPEYHEQATVAGLTGSFSAGEIGQVYEANWKRDFSQGSPLIGQVVLIWKELRDQAAVTGKPDTQLQLQLLKAVSQLPRNLTGESYGGYRYWEHMDNPGPADAADAEARWSGGGPASADIPGYIADSRASVKEMLASAILAARLGRGASAPDSGRTRADAWSRGTPPADYDMWNAYAGRTLPPTGYGAAKAVDDPKHSTSIVAAEATAAASAQPGSVAAPTPGFAADPSIADNLGRASHLIEDFFAHSNFVELATATAAGGTVSPRQLKTGTFEAPDKAHSLAGKLRDTAAEIRANKPLLPLVADRVIDALEQAAAGAELVSGALGPKPDSHTRLAKDSPRAAGFALAHELATAADRDIFFWVHRVMVEPSADRAQRDTYVLFQLVDVILTVPSDTHPLKAIYQRASGNAGSPP